MSATVTRFVASGIRLFDYLGYGAKPQFFKLMSQHDELPVYKASYDLLLEIFRFTKDFTKEYKYTVGESLKKETIELITLIYRANSRKDKYDTLQFAREHIEVIRLFIPSVPKLGWTVLDIKL